MAKRCIAVTGLLALALVARAPAQSLPPAQGGFTHSLGQPDAWKWTAGLSLGWGGRHDGVENGGTATGQIGVMRDMLNPVLGAGGWNFEWYMGARDTRPTGGMRARIASPALRIGVGADYNVYDDQLRPLFSLYSPVIRGGFFRNGTELRLDVLPSRHPQFAIGTETPMMRRIPAGKTRPRVDHVKLPGWKAPALVAPPNAAQIRAPLANARHAADIIWRLNTPFLDEISANRSRYQNAVLTRLSALKRVLADHRDSTPAIEAHTRRFHAEVERAFAVAAGVDSSVVAAHARATLLEHVLLPYNRLLGQVKRSETTEAFAKRARAEFMRWLVAETTMSRERTDATAWVFSQVLAIVEDSRAAIRRDWGDSRFVWLPLQYGLKPEEHDTQAELDALVERAVGVRFTDGNAMSYVINEQFQYQLSRTIHAARDYHLLWIHDFRGSDANGQPDAMSYAHVLHSYLAALIQRVHEYDRTGRIPVFMILIDEWFYQVNAGKVFLSVLEDPMRYRLALKGRDDWERTLAAAQDSLRRAVAQSQLLQAHRAQFGDAWLHNLLKVHVSVTNTSDPSFWSWRVTKLIPLFDNLMRDHRKLAFYDITEEDPYRGEALFTGAGVGEHYANDAWEDRALLVRGPALLELKTGARTALLQQGMKADRIPWHLQPREFAPDYGARVAAFVARERQSLRALTINNETGFGDKQVNVAKGVLYTLMPPGSVIKIPDSLWNSAFWGSALVGCALRGVRVLIIGPALHNAPADVFGSMIRSHELFWSLLAAHRELGPEISRAGGLLRVGLFATDVAATDVAGKMRAANQAFAHHAWLRELFGFPSSVYAGLASIATQVEGTPSVRLQGELETDSRPKLHLKANFFASRDAWALMGRPEWSDMARQFVEQRLTQVKAPVESLSAVKTVPPPLLDVGPEMVTQWFEQLSPEARARVVFYTVMGSQNQNARSMVEDGEVAIVVSSWPSIIPYLDLVTLIGQSRWLDDPSQLDPLLPVQGRVKRSLAHWMKLAF
jgi:hypothetical protein